MQQKKITRCVVDSSAAIAFIQEELGQDVAAQYLEETPIISAVNFSEIIFIGFKNGYDKLSKSKLLQLLPTVIDFNIDQAYLTASLQPLTKKYGLSFADCACLALGKSMNLPIITADKVWKELDIGVEIILIR